MIGDAYEIYKTYDGSPSPSPCNVWPGYEQHMKKPSWGVIIATDDEQGRPVTHQVYTATDYRDACLFEAELRVRIAIREKERRDGLVESKSGGAGAAASTG